MPAVLPYDERRLRVASNLADLLAGDFDAIFHHSGPHEIAAIGERRAHAEVFGGPGTSTLRNDLRGVYRARRVSTAALHDAVLMRNSMTILDRGGRHFAPAMENLPDPLSLASYDPDYAIDEAGALAVRGDTLAALPYVEEAVVPVCCVGFNNYGHFLLDGLSSAYMLKRAFPNVRTMGPPLKPWQAEILAMLDLDDDYLAIERSTRFKTILGSTTLSMHLSYPTRGVRPVFDRIALGCDAEVRGRRVFLSRAGDRSRRSLTNREALEIALQSRGYEVLDPATLTVREQVAFMAGSSIIVGEAGAAMANVGFADPGAKVVEIQPDGFPEIFCRNLCGIMGLEWHAYFTRAERAVDGSLAHFVDIGNFLEFVQRVEDRTP